MNSKLLIAGTIAAMTISTSVAETCAAGAAAGKTCTGVTILIETADVNCSGDTISQPASQGTSWAMASDICTSKGQMLCSREEVCPSGKLQPPIGGMRGSDVWVATSGASNEWTSIGNYNPPVSNILFVFSSCSFVLDT